MKCPICDIEMRTAEREGVEIDYCSQCRGVWLDRGELEKIIARVESQQSRDRGDDKDPYDDDSDSHSGDRESQREGQSGRREDSYRGGRKREGFLSNVFDMFGD
jgi:hypothetical protein